MPFSFVPGAPGPAVRGAVQRYIGYTESGAPLRRREVATGSVTVILSFGPRIRCDGIPHESFVAGLSDVPVITEHDGEQHGIEINLAPLAARRLLGVPMHELTNEVIPLEDMLAAPTLLEELAEAPDWPARFARLDGELARRLGTPARAAPRRSRGVRAARGDRRHHAGRGSWPPSWAGAGGISARASATRSASRRRPTRGSSGSSARRRCWRAPSPTWPTWR